MNRCSRASNADTAGTAPASTVPKVPGSGPGTASWTTTWSRSAHWPVDTAALPQTDTPNKQRRLPTPPNDQLAGHFSGRSSYAAAGTSPGSGGPAGTQHSGLAFSSDRRARIPRVNLPMAAPFGLGSRRGICVYHRRCGTTSSARRERPWPTFGRGSALATRCPSSLPLCFRHRQQFVDRESLSG